jgi:hypothetical protein
MRLQRQIAERKKGGIEGMKQGRSGEQGLAGMEGKYVMKENDRSRDKAERKKEGI